MYIYTCMHIYIYIQIIWTCSPTHPSVLNQNSHTSSLKHYTINTMNKILNTPHTITPLSSISRPYTTDSKLKALSHNDEAKWG